LAWLPPIHIGAALYGDVVVRDTGVYTEAVIGAVIDRTATVANLGAGKANLPVVGGVLRCSILSVADLCMSKTYERKKGKETSNRHCFWLDPHGERAAQ